MSLASAKRIGELQALSKLGFKGNSMVLLYVNDFIAKTESVENHIPRHFIIEDISHLVPGQVDRVLCPVNCLKYYLDRVSNVRGSHNRLFCSVRDPSKPLP